MREQFNLNNIDDKTQFAQAKRTLDSVLRGDPEPLPSSTLENLDEAIFPDLGEGEPVGKDDYEADEPSSVLDQGYAETNGFSEGEGEPDAIIPILELTNLKPEQKQKLASLIYKETEGKEKALGEKEALELFDETIQEIRNEHLEDDISDYLIQVAGQEGLDLLEGFILENEPAEEALVEQPQALETGADFENDPELKAALEGYYDFAKKDFIARKLAAKPKQTREYLEGVFDSLWKAGDEEEAKAEILQAPKNEI